MRPVLKVILAVATLALAAPLAAQTKLKWAHVYETSEPFHKWSVWAAAEIEKRTNGRYHIDVFPASSLGKESDINQGLTLGTVDMIISGLSVAARTMPRRGVGDSLRVPDAPLYTMFPRAVGANSTPIAFAEVYLALQNGTVDAQENPLTTIEAKKFYEVQKNIILTGHIVDSLATQVAPHVWNKLSDADKRVFFDVTREAAANATADIKKREAQLADEFRKKGLNVHAVDKTSFQDAIMKTVSLESMGYSKADWDKIQAIK